MRLGDVIKVVSGYAFKSDLFNTNGEGMPIIRIRDISKEKASTYYSGEYSDEYIVNKGDFLVGMDGEFSITEWKGGRSLLNQRVCKIVPDKNVISPRYLLKILPRELKKIEDRTPFVTVKHLSVKSINAIKLPHPPLPVQERIATILDAADTLRQKDQALLKKYDELTQSLFLNMFGDPLTNPFGWDKVTLGDLLLEAKYGTSAKASDDGQYPYLRMNNITYNGYMDFF